MRAEASAPRARQSGFFLIEALVAILIFALGVLGLVALGGTAVASQSDAQYRTEAGNLADAIAGEMAMNIDRTNEASRFPSLAKFSHQPGGVDCAFSGAVATDPIVKGLVDRAANLPVGTIGLPGATDAMQQVLVAPAGTFNRVEITLCWKTANDVVARKHKLVTYIN